MKTKTTISAICAALVLTGLCHAQGVKDSARPSLAAGDLAPATDILPVTDISAGTAGSKKITINDVFTGWGFTTAGATVAKAADLAAIKTFLNYGTAASLDHGTAAGNLVRLDVTTGKLPAVDGSLLTNLPGGVLASQAEAEAGSENTKTMTALRTKQAVAAYGVESADIGSTVQAWDAGLDTFAALAAPGTSGYLLSSTTGGVLSWVAPSSGNLLAANNLSDLTDPTDARLHLGVIIGTDVQGYDTDLASWAGVTRASGFDAFTATPSSANLFNLLADKQGTGGGVVFSDDAYLLDARLNGVTIDTGFDAEGDMYFRTDASGGTSSLAIGTNGQILTVASGLPSWATPAFEPALGNPASNGYVLSSTTAGVRSWIALAGGGDLLAANNLSDLANAGTARTNLGLGTAATLDHGTANGNLVRLDATTGKLPAVDGSLLTNLPAAPALSNFTESVNTSTPNATVPAVQLLATNAATNVDFILTPKGTGTLAAQIPDNTSTGGNKRGTTSVDWQRARSVATRVASGNLSVIGGGSQNTASGQNSTVAGGLTNAATNNYATVAGGTGNTASGNESSVVGGDGNTASGENSIAGGLGCTASGDQSVAMGYQTQATGTYSTAFGLQGVASANNSTALGYSNTANGVGSLGLGYQSTTRSTLGMISHAGGRVAANGDVQVGRYAMFAFTNSATPTILQTTSGGGTRFITLANNSTYSFTGQLAARSSTGDSATWRFSGTIERGANAAATALIGTPTQTDTNAEAGAAAWALTISADTTNGALKFEATGAAATNIRWSIQVETAEVVY